MIAQVGALSVFSSFVHYPCTKNINLYNFIDLRGTAGT